MNVENLLENIMKGQNKMMISVAKIEEHLKTLNGSVLRHEKKLDKIDDEMKDMNEDIHNNKLSIAKFLGWGGLGGGAASGIIYIVIKLMGIS